ncbi:hypothetical protein P22_1158 [Propionispora sp. 2/2-37]|uniref:class I SAM-dependent methyltransferase n=1 Tax=Propionispora sp. 2/2-37 TaxID=1677858 RepID=UPI0006BB58CE|nr:class I SAM-dependent methyltransferase [Propionispora sp. 2/2-37]CUH95089.1 hypothetical protein P22_1158 [Propionispora sp. 2/2-37]
MRRIIRCPVCKVSDGVVFLEHKQVATCQHTLIATAEAARNVERGDLTLVCCRQCNFIFNTAFDEQKLAYGEAYENSQSYSPYFSQYMDEIIDELVKEKETNDCRVIEVGCGQGTFLKRLIDREPGIYGYGFDPSYRGPLTLQDGRITFFQSNYGPDAAHIMADIVICRHVIEHVSQPVSLLQSIRQAIKASAQARLFLETPCSEWILRNEVFWDFFYEHCSYFSRDSLARAVELSGFRVQNVFHRFHGQYLWLEARLHADDKLISGPSQATPLYFLARQFAYRERDLIARWSELIQSKIKQGERIALWGAGAKGATFAGLLDPACRYFQCVVDINPQKQGKYLPGTGHPIIKPAELPDLQISSIIILNPNYRNEIVNILKGMPGKINLLELENDK